MRTSGFTLAPVIRRCVLDAGSGPLDRDNRSKLTLLVYCTYQPVVRTFVLLHVLGEAGRSDVSQLVT